MALTLTKAFFLLPSNEEMISNLIYPKKMEGKKGR